MSQPPPPYPQQPNYPPPSSGMSVLMILLIVGGIIVIVGGAIIAILIALLLPAIQQARTAARNTQSRNNLQIIGLALHNYNDSYQTFPPGGIYDANGEGHHGWQYSLLPYIEQGPIFDGMDPHTPWNTGINAEYSRTQIPTYLSAAESQTTDAEGYALSHYAGNELVLGPNSNVRLFNITDGTSNTVIAGEVSGNYKPWAHPANYRDPTKVGFGGGPDSFGRPDGGVANILLMDGSTRTIAPEIDPAVWKALSTPAGNDAVGEF